MVSWLTQQRENELSAVCPVCRRDISSEDAEPYIKPVSDAPTTLSAQTLMMLLTLMCSVPCGRPRPGGAFWGHENGAPTPAAGDEGDDDGDNEGGWRERLAALYAPHDSSESSHSESECSDCDGMEER